MSAMLHSWREIAYRDDGVETLHMSRATLRLLFAELEARAKRAEADADQLADLLASRLHMNSDSVPGEPGTRVLTVNDPRGTWALAHHADAVSER